MERFDAKYPIAKSIAAISASSASLTKVGPEKKQTLEPSLSKTIPHIPATTFSAFLKDPSTMHVNLVVANSFSRKPFLNW